MNSDTETLPASPTAKTPAPLPHQGKSPKAGAPAKRQSAWKPILGFVVAAAALAWVVQFSLHAYRYEHTDDAYLTGHLHAVSPQIDAQVKDVLVRDNQEVKAGDVLVRLDPTRFDLAVQKARVAIEQAKAQAGAARAAAAQATAGLAEAQARVRQAESQSGQSAAQREVAQLNYARFEQLFKNGGAATQADLDNSRGAYRQAEAADAANQANIVAAKSAVSSAEATLKSAEAQITAADANVAAAEVAARDAEREQGYTAITAPSDGRIGNRTVEAGNRVVAGQTLFSLASPDLWIVANFKETQLARMQPNQEVELEIDAIPSHAFHGKIDSVSPASGAQFALLPPDNATGNFNKVVQRVPVKILLDEKERAEFASRLRLGLSVVVNVRTR